MEGMKKEINEILIIGGGAAVQWPLYPHFIDVVLASGRKCREQDQNIH